MIVGVDSMSHQTGIECNADLVKSMARCKSGDIRAMKITIKNEELQLDEQSTTGCSWDWDWDRVVPSFVKPKQPTFVLFRLDSKNTMGYEWVLISWSPEDSPIRQKMLYASTKATLKKQFGNSQIVQELFSTTEDEVTLRGYKNFLKMKEAPPPLSLAEAELENVKLSESNAVDRVNTLGSVALPISAEAKQAISSLTAGTTNYVQLSIDLKGEVVNLGENATVKVSELSKKLPENQASYILFTFSHTYEGDTHHSLVFIYSMPAGVASIRERMMYSSCKAAVVDTIQTELQLNIVKKLEIGDREDLTEQYLIDEIHPKQLVYRPKFEKPKGPLNRGQRRIARVNQ